MYVKFVHSELQALGIEYLSAVLKERGYRTGLIVDPYFNILKTTTYFIKYFVNYRETLLKRILSDNPDLIAFSVTSCNLEWVCKLASLIKEYSVIPVVLGGIQATLMPEIILEKSNADFLIRGEGEIALCELVQSLRSRKIDFAIKNLCFRTDSKVLINPMHELIPNLDDLPLADKEILPHWFNRKLYRIIAGRGCFGNCSYCCAPIQKKLYGGNGKFVRYRSVSNIINELKDAKKNYKIRRVFFEDDFFIYNREWLKELSSQYKNEINLPCFLHVTPEAINEEIVTLLKDMMCYFVEIGVQSLNQEIKQHILLRRDTVRDVKNAVSLLKRNGINCICDNIIGIPGEDKEDIAKLVEFYNELRPGKVEVSRLGYFPQATIIEKAPFPEKIIDNIRKHGLYISETDNPVDTAKIMLLLGLSYILPKRIISKILKTKLYRFLPYIYDFNSLNHSLFYISSLFKKSKAKTFVSLRADIMHKLKYLVFNYNQDNRIRKNERSFEGD